MPGYTDDTGMLIKLLDRHDARARLIHRRALEGGASVPTVCWAEYFRGQWVDPQFVASVSFESLSRPIAELAGRALRKVKDVQLADAVVVAGAALRGDLVVTSDLPDISRLAAHFPSVRVLRV